MKVLAGLPPHNRVIHPRGDSNSISSRSSLARNTAPIR